MYDIILHAQTNNTMHASSYDGTYPLGLLPNIARARTADALPLVDQKLTALESCRTLANCYSSCMQRMHIARTS